MEDLFKDKMYRCKYYHSDIFSDTEANSYCGCGIAENIPLKDYPKITKDKCKNCPNFKSIFIEYPIVVNNIENNFGNNGGIGHEVGVFVKIRPCGDEYNKKTYLGIYLGDLPISNYVAYNKKTENLSILPNRNPAIYVPELRKIIYGYESWWCEIKDEKEIKDITDSDINNQWYMQLAKSLSKGE